MNAATISIDVRIDRELPSRRITARSVAFAAMLMFVGTVSVYDAYLVLRTGDMIRDFEKNPVGLWLIEANHGDPAVFLMAKGAGTLCALGLLTVLYRRSQRLAFPIASAILLFQAGLLVFLETN